MLNRMAMWVATVVTCAKRNVTTRDELGASLVEYALLLALIAVVAVGALVLLGGSVSNTLNQVGHTIDQYNTTTT